MDWIDVAWTLAWCLLVLVAYFLGRSDGRQAGRDEAVETLRRIDRGGV